MLCKSTVFDAVKWRSIKWEHSVENCQNWSFTVFFRPPKKSIKNVSKIWNQIWCPGPGNSTGALRAHVWNSRFSSYTRYCMFSVRYAGLNCKLEKYTFFTKKKTFIFSSARNWYQKNIVLLNHRTPRDFEDSILTPRLTWSISSSKFTPFLNNLTKIFFSFLWDVCVIQKCKMRIKKMVKA